MIVTVCLNPTLQKTLEFDSLHRGEVNRAVDHRWDASGKGVNVSRVLTQLGHSVMHITQLGGRNRLWFTDMLLDDGIPVRSIASNAEIRSCYTVIEKNGNVITELVEEGALVTSAVEAAVQQAYTDALADSLCQAVIISGSKAKGFSDGLFPSMVCQALKAGLPVVADYRGKDLINTLQQSLTVQGEKKLVIKPNFEEFCQSFFSQLSLKDVSDSMLESRMAELHDEFGCLVIVTRGSKPVVAYNGKQLFKKKLYKLPADMRVRNTIGCGDSFTAGFTAAYLEGKPFDECLEEGNRCGALNAANIRPGSIKE